MKDEKSRILRRLCGAILEYRDKVPYKDAVKKASAHAIIKDLSKKQNQNLIEAIILNTLNYKEYSFETLARKFELPVAHGEFSRKKMEFCEALAKECGFFRTQQPTAEKWTKEEVLNMLYSIADEANDCITNDEGVFNHQVAGVALKAIDQAVRLSGMLTGSEPDNQEIALEENASRMGA